MQKIETQRIQLHRNGLCAELRAKAARVRWHAKALAHDECASRLAALADELDTKANALEAGMVSSSPARASTSTPAAA